MCVREYTNQSTSDIKNLPTFPTRSNMILTVHCEREYGIQNFNNMTTYTLDVTVWVVHVLIHQLMDTLDRIILFKTLIMHNHSALHYPCCNLRL